MLTHRIMSDIKLHQVNRPVDVNEENADVVEEEPAAQGQSNRVPVPLPNFKNSSNSAKAAAKQCLERFESGQYRLLSTDGAPACTTDRHFMAADKNVTQDDVDWFRCV